MNRPLYQTVILAGADGPAFPEIPTRTQDEAQELDFRLPLRHASCLYGRPVSRRVSGNMNRIQNVVITYKDNRRRTAGDGQNQISWQQAENQGSHTTSRIFERMPEKIRPYDNAWNLYYDETYPEWKTAMVML